MKMHPGSRAAAAFVAALAACGAAWATPTTAVDVGAGFDSSSLTGTSPLDVSAQSSLGGGGPGAAQASAHAGFGSLGIYASASANGGYAFPVIGASASASFSDDMFVGGVAGTMVTLTITLGMEGSCSATEGGSYGYVNAACSVEAGLVAPPGVSLSSGLNAQHMVDSVTFDWAAGTSFGFGAQMMASGYANFGSFSADYAHTLHLYIDTLTDGVTLTSASGHDYATPLVAGGGTVPEPASWALAAVGLAVLARRPRRALSRAA